MTVGLSNVFYRFNFRQKLFCHFCKITDTIGMSGKHDVPTGHNAEQNRHFRTEMKELDYTMLLCINYVMLFRFADPLCPKKKEFTKFA